MSTNSISQGELDPTCSESTKDKLSKSQLIDPSLSPIMEKWQRFKAVQAARSNGMIIWDVLDYDTRKWTAVQGSEHEFGEENDGIGGADRAVEALAALADRLDEQVTKITLPRGQTGVEGSIKPEDDCTPVLYFPKWTIEAVGKADFRRTIYRSQLEEMKRIGPTIDLVKVNHSSGSDEFLEFKYLLAPPDEKMEQLWREAWINKFLAAKSYVASFKYFVLEDATQQFLGFTTNEISGRYLRNDRRTLRKVWITNLMDAVDDLNLVHGIFHQDISTLNVFVDSDTDRVSLSNFKHAAHRDSVHCKKETTDLKGILLLLWDYLTKDEDGPLTPLALREQLRTSDMQKWPVTRNLEPGLTIEKIKELVNQWLYRRTVKREKLVKQGKFKTKLDLPKMPYLNGTDTNYWDPEALKKLNEPLDDYSPYYRRDRCSAEHAIYWERATRASLKQRRRRGYVEPEQGEEVTFALRPST